jgi:hypothetical protein
VRSLVAKPRFVLLVENDLEPLILLIYIRRSLCHGVAYWYFLYGSK